MSFNTHLAPPLHLRKQRGRNCLFLGGVCDEAGRERRTFKGLLNCKSLHCRLLRSLFLFEGCLQVDAGITHPCLKLGAKAHGVMRGLSRGGVCGSTPRLVLQLSSAWLGQTHSTAEPCPYANHIFCSDWGFEQL